ncbi:hypothetical protein DdX_17323 [Ditylenchus destructor]|uniref:Uncharacterized protein n=1 Tax=Ditylenchus destructor TaxID=166010 RepID=A0AAD4QVW7_9BILA|nr:hypothetical protein DdX_17323 [Ditylenchus destructor]
MLFRILSVIFLFAPISCKPHKYEIQKQLNDGTELRGRLDLKNLHHGPEVEAKKNFQLDDNTQLSKTSAEAMFKTNLNDQTSLSGKYHTREGAGIEFRTSSDDQTSLAARAHSNSGPEVVVSKQFEKGEGSLSISQSEDGGARIGVGIKVTW